jgi:quercetin dioxygenase-like cupin family protein
VSEYFDSTRVARQPGAAGRFTHVDGVPPIEAAPGVVLHAVSGEQVMLSYVTIAPHSTAPVHVHSEEQMGVIVSGTCEFHLDGETRALGPGAVYLAPPGVPHGVTTGAEPCVVVDVFSPPRAALLAMLDEGPAHS